ncbi:MAG TPA: tetratricopeptide repeat protein [Planctomycetes bacterium]|nr:tetratricopeptide repeat protein [Planctomycetota bacterium]
MNRDPARYRRLCHLFERALELEGADREQFVMESCGDDSELRGHLLAALLEAEAGSSFLERPWPAARILQPALRPPEIVAGYRILDLLGEGGMGTVYSAQQLEPLREVALKTIPITGAPPLRQRRFRREARCLAKLRHPNIAAIYEAGEFEVRGGRYAFIAMEMVDGWPLDQVFRSRRDTKLSDDDGLHALACRLDELPEWLKFFRALAGALDAAHAAGIVHRDVKPQNVIVRRSGEPVLVDFGIARDLEGTGEALTRTSAPVGTPAYMAPEQVEGGSAVDGRSDVWGVGVMLYEALSGRRPFEEATQLALMESIRLHDPPPLAKESRRYPRDVEAVVERALTKEVSRRYASAALLADDLDALLEGRPVRARRAGPLSRLFRAGRRRPGVAALVAVAVVSVLALAALGGFLWASWDDLQAGRREVRRTEVRRALDRAWMAVLRDESSDARRLFQKLLGDGDAADEARAGLRMISWIGPGAHPAKDESMDPAFRAFLEGQKALESARHGDPAAWKLAEERFADAIIRSVVPRPLFHFALASAVGARGSAERALAAARGLTQRFPEEPQAWKAAGFTVLRKVPEEALRMFERARELGADDLETDHGIAMAHFYAGRPDEAVRRLREIVSGSPDAAAPWMSLTNVLTVLGHRDEARRAEKEAEARGAGGLEWLRIRGERLRAEGRWKEALDIYEKAAKIAPRHPRILERLGGLQRKVGKLAPAASTFKRWTDVQPGNYRSWLEFSTVVVALGRLREAIAAADRALELKPGNTAALVNRSGALRMWGALTSAERDARAVIARDPRSAESYLNLGLIHHEQFRLQEALEDFEVAHRLGALRSSWPHPTADFIAKTKLALRMKVQAPSWVLAMRSASKSIQSRDWAQALTDLESCLRLAEQTLDGAGLMRLSRRVLDDELLGGICEPESETNLPLELDVRRTRLAVRFRRLAAGKNLAAPAQR